MIDGYAAFGQYFLKVTIGNRITDIKEYGIKDDIFGEMSPLKSIVICYYSTHNYAR